MGLWLEPGPWTGARLMIGLWLEPGPCSGGWLGTHDHHYRRGHRERMRHFRRRWLCRLQVSQRPGRMLWLLSTSSWLLLKLPAAIVSEWLRTGDLLIRTMRGLGSLTGESRAPLVKPKEPTPGAGRSKGDQAAISLGDGQRKDARTGRRKGQAARRGQGWLAEGNTNMPR